MAERSIEYERQTVEAKLPCLITVMPELNQPRTPSPNDRSNALQETIKIWDSADLSLTLEEVGFNGSLVDILRSSQISVNKNPLVLQGEEDEVIGRIVDILKRSLV